MMLQRRKRGVTPPTVSSIPDKVPARPAASVQSQDSGDSYHCCRWCKYAECHGGEWVCTCPAYSASIQADLTDIAESGRLALAIEESFSDRYKEEFRNVLAYMLQNEFRVSGSRVQRFKQVFDEHLEEFLKNTTSDIDGAVSKLYQNAQDEIVFTTGISDPYTHCCKEFW